MGSRLILSSGFTIRRACYARVFTPLGKAATSRPEESGRLDHGGPDISSGSPDVKMAGTG